MSELGAYDKVDQRKISRAVRHFESGGDVPPRRLGGNGNEAQPNIRAILLEDLDTDTVVKAAILKMELTNEVQDISLVGDVVGGTFTLSYPGENVAETTDAIASDATADEMRLALEGLPSFNNGDLIVSAFPGRWRIEFTGQFAGEDVAGLLADGDNLISGSTGLTNAVVTGISVWVDSGGDPIDVRAGLPVLVPTPLVSGTTVFAVWHEEAGYSVIASEPRDFYFTPYEG